VVDGALQALINDISVACRKYDSGVKGIDGAVPAEAAASLLEVGEGLVSKLAAGDSRKTWVQWRMAQACFVVVRWPPALLWIAPHSFSRIAVQPSC
jgi:hypothetical protein